MIPPGIEVELERTTPNPTRGFRVALYKYTDKSSEIVDLVAPLWTTENLNIDQTNEKVTVDVVVTDEYLDVANSGITVDDITVYVDGTDMTSSNYVNKELSQPTPLTETRTINGVDTEVQYGIKYTLTLKNWIEEARQEGKMYKEWSGETKIKIAAGTANDQYGNTSKEQEFLLGQVDFVNPEIMYQQATTQISQTEKEVTIVFSVTDKYFNNSKTPDQYLNADDLRILIDEKEPTWKVEGDTGAGVTKNLTFEAITEQRAKADGTTENVTIGYKCTLVLTEQKVENEKRYLDYNNGIEIEIPEGKFKDTSDNVNIAQTITLTKDTIHGPSENIKEYKKTKEGHTPIYECTVPGCDETYEGEEEAHTGGTHENDGTCTVEGCRYKYQTHEQSENIKEYKKTATGHTPVYSCTYTGCTGTFDGVEEAHTGGTHENGGICTVEGCRYKYQTHEQSENIKEYKKTATGHTPVYKCTEESCEVTYEEVEEGHNYETYVDNGDGTHSSTCTKCEWPTTENHNYENGKCKECGINEPEIEIKPGDYEILNAYITQIQPETTVSTFKNEIVTDATEIKIYNKNNEELKDTDIIVTGMKLELKKGTQTKNYTLIVKGDVNGDGTATMADIMIINQYRLNKRNLGEIYLIAGDVTGDGRTNFLDIVKINIYKLHKITEL